MSYLPCGEVQAWADRLAMREAADDVEGRDVIEIQRTNSLIPGIPDDAMRLKG
ncbi:hypothetical protein [Paracoccus sp. (in: a-proteobacteria)]|uniref:hypothetical protein n=1 Tax=Paracoccus sp. TaxID=267 RepID=UPI0026E0E126|nr:hypothetical protein [Paracoccus sp. (in: a-proteobacteria)]MDO5648656.1 hypothetical protein [Paracoccus sp. (in: a-proteobacteria)]